MFLGCYRSDGGSGGCTTFRPTRTRWRDRPDGRMLAG